MTSQLTRAGVLDLYFPEARCKLIEIAAFLDRLDRAEGAEDFRALAFREAMQCLAGSEAHRAEKVLLALSDPTVEPIPQAHGKGAVGAWPGATAV
ncbi:MAG: hypothetical protein JNK85_28395 [Verrucomicrobiales bacterium]|nr:hypothetical protein [Verrucomicrobiales bacterium]